MQGKGSDDDALRKLLDMRFLEVKQKLADEHTRTMQLVASHMEGRCQHSPCEADVAKPLEHDQALPG